MYEGTDSQRPVENCEKTYVSPFSSCTPHRCLCRTSRGRTSPVLQYCNKALAEYFAIKLARFCRLVAGNNTGRKHTSLSAYGPKISMCELSDGWHNYTHRSERAAVASESQTESVCLSADSQIHQPLGRSLTSAPRR